MKTVEIRSALAEIVPEDHFHHPGLRNARFIFCDDLPNDNKQGIEYEDFPAIMQSIVGTPVKMRFLGNDVAGHASSIPIGFIQSTEEALAEDGSHQIIANAILFASEYPDEIDFLEQKFAEKKAPGVSWELGYNDSLVKNGIEWLKGIIAKAATFVREPAYGSRTALLALASNKAISADDFSTELSAFANEFSPKTTDKGGNNNVDEELKKAQEALAEALAQMAELKAANESLTAEKETLTQAVAEKEAMIAEKDTALAAIAQRDLIAERARTITEAGIVVETDEEKLSKAFWVHLNDEAFAEYIDTLKAVVPVKPKDAAASLRQRVETPRFSPPKEAAAATSTSELKDRFKSFRYSTAEIESE